MAKDGFNGIHRDEWVDGVKPARLRAAAIAKKAFHQKRVKHWEGVREAAKKKFEKSGMKLVEKPQFDGRLSTAAYTSNKVRSAEVDYELAEQWQTANAKVEQHKAKVREYEKWRVFLLPSSCDSNDGDDGACLDLTFADMEYFGLLGDNDPKEQ
jgi:hypothetical protein